MVLPSWWGSMGMKIEVGFRRTNIVVALASFEKRFHGTQDLRPLVWWYFLDHIFASSGNIEKCRQTLFFKFRNSMEPILACRPALCTECLGWVAISGELWRICTGPTRTSTLNMKETRRRFKIWSCAVEVSLKKVVAFLVFRRKTRKVKPRVFYELM